MLKNKRVYKLIKKYYKIKVKLKDLNLKNKILLVQNNNNPTLNRKKDQKLKIHQECYHKKILNFLRINNQFKVSHNRVKFQKIKLKILINIF